MKTQTYAFSALLAAAILIAAQHARADNATSPPGTPALTPPAPSLPPPASTPPPPGTAYTPPVTAFPTTGYQPPPTGGYPPPTSAYPPASGNPPPTAYPPTSAYPPPPPSTPPPQEPPPQSYPAYQAYPAYPVDDEGYGWRHRGHHGGGPSFDSVNYLNFRFAGMGTYQSGTSQYSLDISWNPQMNMRGGYYVGFNLGGTLLTDMLSNNFVSLEYQLMLGVAISDPFGLEVGLGGETLDV